MRMNILCTEQQKFGRKQRATNQVNSKEETFYRVRLIQPAYRLLDLVTVVVLAHWVTPETTIDISSCQRSGQKKKPTVADAVMPIAINEGSGASLMPLPR